MLRGSPRSSCALFACRISTRSVVGSRPRGLIPRAAWRLSLVLAVVVASAALIAAPRIAHTQPPVGETPGPILPRQPTPLEPEAQLPRLGRVLVQRINTRPRRG